MQLSSINNQRYSQNINFESCLRKYSPLKNKKIFSTNEEVRTTTDFFRTGSNLAVLIDYIMLYFCNKPKVNIYSLASSDGSEAYSCAILLIEQLKNKIFGKFLPMSLIGVFQSEKLNKYFPIHASDVDSTIIDSAKKRRINIKENEWKVNKNLFKKYFKKPEKYVQIDNDNTKKEGLLSYKPVKLLQKAVEFKNSDILIELNSIKDEGNSVVICSNVFPYLNDDYVNKILIAAHNNLKSGSLFVIGGFDFESRIHEKLRMCGFYNPIPGFNNIFQRI